MTLQVRTLIMTVTLVILSVAATTAILSWTARDALLDTIQDQGVGITRRIGIAGNVFEQIAQDAEEIVGEHMIVEATIAAHLVAVAEAAGLSPDEINAHLQEIVDRTALDEFWITDESGHAYLRSNPDVDFRFNPDPGVQPQASEFWPVLTGQRPEYVQASRVREIDDQTFKYAAVAGIDKPRIVQVGYGAQIQRVRQQTDSIRLNDELVNAGNLNAIRVVDSNLATLELSIRGRRPEDEQISERDAEALRRVIAGGVTTSYVDGSVLKVMAPVIGATGGVTGAAFVQFPTDHVTQTIGLQLKLAAGLAVLVVVAGVGASIFLARRVTRPVGRLTAAAGAVESNEFDPENLADVASRRDEIGKLARVFQSMAREVDRREQRLRRQLEDLRIAIDQTRKARDVAEITETEYFQRLEQRAQQLRERAARPSGAAG